MNDADIYAELRTDLMRYATALVGVSDAADVVSAVVTRVMAQQGLTGLTEPRPYLMRSVLNEARMRYRSRSREVRAVNALHTQSSQSVDAHHDHVLDVVMGLPPRQRAAVFLAYYEQYMPAEIADLMGCRPATVRRYLHLARARLKVDHADPAAESHFWSPVVVVVDTRTGEEVGRWTLDNPVGCLQFDEQWVVACEVNAGPGPDLDQLAMTAINFDTGDINRVTTRTRVFLPGQPG